MPKNNLSLLAQYDDFCRGTSDLLQSSYIDVSLLIAQTEENRIKWLKADTNLKEANRQIRVLLARNLELETKIQNLERTYEREEQKNKNKEKENNRLRGILNIVRKTVTEDQRDSSKKGNLRTFSSESFRFMKSILNDPHQFLQNNPLKVEVIPPKVFDNSDDEELNFDKTDESQDQSSEEQDIVSPKCFSDIKDELNFEKVEFKKNPSFSQSISDHLEMDLKTDSEENDLFIPKIPVKSSTRSPLKLLSSNVSVISEKAQDTDSKFKPCSHTLIKKKFYRTAVCNVCKKRIGFCSDALQCESCKNVTHFHCQQDLEISCSPSIFSKQNEDTDSIDKYASKKIPPLVSTVLICCFKEIENRGMLEKGIYRKEGSDKEIQEFKKKILNSKSNFEKLDHNVHTLCSIVKFLLKSLEEPLISSALWNDFVNTTENFASSSLAENERLYIRLLNRLPHENRVIFAYIILHLKNVAEHSKFNQMGEYSLAKIFARSIIGCSTSSKTEENTQIGDYSKQITCMHAMISMPKSFWESILEQPQS